MAALPHLTQPFVRIFFLLARANRAARAGRSFRPHVMLTASQEEASLVMPRQKIRRERRKRWVAQQRGGLRQVWPAVRTAFAIVPPAALLTVWLAGLIVRVFFRDELDGLAGRFFYATPPVVIVALPVMAGIWRLVARAWKTAGVALLIAAGTGFWAYPSTWRHVAPAPPAAHRLLFWNVSWGDAGWDALAAAIRAQRPDVVALVEARDGIPVSDDIAAYHAARGAAAAHMDAFWKRMLPGYQVVTDPSGVAILSKYPLRAVDAHFLEGDYYTSFGDCLTATLRVDETDLTVLVVDLHPPPHVSRREPLTALINLLADCDTDRVLLVGDFNTPPDSVHIDALRQSLDNAYEQAGDGYAATWPMPLPVLTIDQAWSRPGVDVHRCAALWTSESDHRPLLLEFSLPPRPSAP
jgi:endonuclease/exonuclease/phosphatase family metal-dependent hydrolase